MSIGSLGFCHGTTSGSSTKVSADRSDGPDARAGPQFHLSTGAMIITARVVLPIVEEPIYGGCVRIADGRIVEVAECVSGMWEDEQVRDLGNVALLPGFVNAHSHIEYTLKRNAVDGLCFWDWIDAIGYRPGKSPDTLLLYESALLGAAECALSGITCLADCSFLGVAARAVEEVGLRGIIYRELFGQSMGAEYPDRIDLLVREITKQQRMLSDRVKLGLSPHSVYTSNDEVLSYCANTDLPISLHLGETQAEADYTVNGSGPIAEWRAKLGYDPMRRGLRPVEVARREGLLREGVCLAHCVHLNRREVRMVASSGVGVVHCPRSNAYLGCGIAPLRDLMSAGARLGLGTDGAASCGTLNFFEEMRAALMLHRAVAKDAGVLTAKMVLEMATLGGARAVGLADCIGSIEPGKAADLIAVDLGDTFPGEDLHFSIVSRSPADVKFVMVDGREIISGGRTLALDPSDMKRIAR